MGTPVMNIRFPPNCICLERGRRDWVKGVAASCEAALNDIEEMGRTLLLHGPPVNKILDELNQALDQAKVVVHSAPCRQITEMREIR